MRSSTTWIQEEKLDPTCKNLGAKPYHDFCREERSHAAIFYALLCREENLRRFVKMCTNAPILEGTCPAPYFEYAYLRDYWASMKSGERQECLLRWLPNELRDEIESLRKTNVQKANERLGVVGRSSSRELQMPGRWGVAKIISKNPGMAKDDLLKLCKLKWSFNIKPDILIELAGNHTICIEAKVCSRQSSYPVSAQERNAFKAAGLEPAGQIEMQEYVLTQLLRRNVTMISLTREPGTATPKNDKPAKYKTLTWGEVYKEMDTLGLPPSAIAMKNWLTGTGSCRSPGSKTESPQE